MADTSIYTRGGAANPVMNPLTALGQIVGIQNAQNQNALFQQQFQANVGAGEAYRAAVDPQSGALDTNALMRAVASDPRIAFRAGDIAAAAQARQKEQLGIDQAALTLSRDRNDAYLKMISPLAARADLKPQDLVKTVVDVGRKFGVPAQEVAQRLIGLPQQGTPDELRQYVTQEFLLPSLDAKTKMDAVIGVPVMQELGGAVQPGVQSPLSGFTPQGSALKKTMTPEAAAQRVPGLFPAPGGGMQPGTVSLAQTTTMPPGSFLPTAPALTPGTNLPPEKAYGQLVDVYDKEAKQMKQVPLIEVLQRAGYGVPQGPGAGSAPKAPPLGAEAAETEAAKRAATAQSQMFESVANSPTRLQGLMEADRLLESGVKTGRGTESVNAMRSYLVSLPGLPKFAKPDEIQVADYDKLTKYLARAATDRAATFGAGTDRQLGAIVAGSPNIGMQTLANKELVKINIALERMEQAMAISAQQENVSAQDHNKWAAKWGTTIDPRAFVVDLLPADKQEKLRDEIRNAKEAARDRFRKSYLMSQTLQGLQ